MKKRSNPELRHDADHVAGHRRFEYGASSALDGVLLSP
jgi:hypothetical protein